MLTKKKQNSNASLSVAYLFFIIYLKSIEWTIHKIENLSGCVWRTALVVKQGIFRQKVMLLCLLYKHLDKLVLQKPFYRLLINTKIINQYHTTYTLYSGLNHVNYLNIIKRNHVSATVRTRLHLASGWSLDHSGAQYSYVGVRMRVGCRHIIAFYNIPPILSVIQIRI